MTSYRLTDTQRALIIDLVRAEISYCQDAVSRHRIVGENDSPDADEYTTTIDHLNAILKTLKADT